MDRLQIPLLACVYQAIRTKLKENSNVCFEEDTIPFESTFNRQTNQRLCFTFIFVEVYFRRVNVMLCNNNC